MTLAGWEDLANDCRACRACPDLAASRSQVVVGTAPAGAALVLVGEAPGAAEDASGEPFVGRAGQLLDALLAEAGLDRSQLAILNALKCRPPGNRAPTAAELARCRGWLTAQLDLLAPSLVCALGRTAAAAFLGPQVRLGAARGRVHQVGGRRLLVTYHPSAALRFGPAGAPRAMLREDLARAAALV
ncbi:MAG: uracil-DNA glycosylase [Mycobacteriales bacterium]